MDLCAECVVKVRKEAMKFDIKFSANVYEGAPATRSKITKQGAYLLLEAGYRTILGTCNDVYLIK